MWRDTFQVQMAHAHSPNRKSIPSWLRSLFLALFAAAIVFAVCIATLKSDTAKEEGFVFALISGVFAYAAASWQLYSGQRTEHKRSHELLGTIIEQVAIEVRDNGNRMRKLQAKLDDRDLKDSMTWGYAYAITQGFRTGAYDLLLGNGLVPYADSKDMEVLYDCYTAIDGVIALVREVHALAEYNQSPEEREEVGLLGKNIVTNNATVISQFEDEQTKAFLNRYLPH